MTAHGGRAQEINAIYVYVHKYLIVHLYYAFIYICIYQKYLFIYLHT